MRWRPSAPARALTQSIAGAVGVLLVRRLDQLELDGDSTCSPGAGCRPSSRAVHARPLPVRAPIDRLSDQVIMIETNCFRRASSTVARRRRGSQRPESYRGADERVSHADDALRFVDPRQIILKRSSGTGSRRRRSGSGW
jgi:hypothetical protein